MDRQYALFLFGSLISILFLRVTLVTLVSKDQKVVLVKRDQLVIKDTLAFLEHLGKTVSNFV